VSQQNAKRSDDDVSTAGTSEASDEERGSRERSSLVIARNQRFLASSQNPKDSDDIPKIGIFGRQRAHYRLAAEALAVSTVDPFSTIYHRAAGALAEFTVDPKLRIYVRSSENRKRSAARVTVYQRARRNP
jgi:hypothetical protein